MPTPDDSLAPMTIYASAYWPGYHTRDVHTATVDEHPIGLPYADAGTRVDHMVGAESGETDILSYTMGEVSSNHVEDFELRGTVLNMPRQAEYSPQGPVGHYDHMLYTAQQLAAQQSPEIVADEILAAIVSAPGFYPAYAR